MSLEPAVILMMTGMQIVYIRLQDLLIEKVCEVNLGYDTELCQAIAKVNSTEVGIEIKIQKTVVDINTYSLTIEHTLTFLLLLVLGPFSDKYGRKLLLLLPPLGSVLETTFYILMLTFSSKIDMYVLRLVGTSIKFLFGGNPVFTMAGFCYIADKTGDSDRTRRLGIFHAADVTGLALGYASGAIITRLNIGYRNSFLIAMGLNVMSLMIVFLTVENGTIPQKKGYVEIEDTINTRKSSPSATSIWGQTKNELGSMLMILFKNREKSRGLCLWILLIAFICASAPFAGEFPVMYLHLREKLGWDAGNFGYFQIFLQISRVLGVMFSVEFFTKRMNISDSVVGLASGFSQIFACIVYALAQTSLALYFASLVGILNLTMIVVARSMISKLIAPNETGKMFTILSLSNVVMSLGMVPLYSFVYKATLLTFSGMFFFLSGLLTLPLLITYLWFSCSKKKYYSTDLETIQLLNHKGEIQNSLA